MIHRTEGSATGPHGPEEMEHATQTSTNGGRKVSTDHRGSFIHRLSFQVLNSLSTLSSLSETRKLSINNLKAILALFILPHALSDEKLKAMSSNEKRRLLNAVRLARRGLSLYGGPSNQKLCDTLDALVQNLLPPPVKEDEKGPSTQHKATFTQEQIQQAFTILIPIMDSAGKTKERREAFETLKNVLMGVVDNPYLEIKALNDIERLARTEGTAEDVIALKEALETCKSLASLSLPVDKQTQARLDEGYAAAQKAVDAASKRVVSSLLGKES